MRDWAALDADEQLALRMEYDRANGARPGTCDLRAKNRRFHDWLAGRDIDFPLDDADRDDALRPDESLADRFARWRG